MKMLTDHYQLRQAHAVNAPAPRCVKDIIEEKRFDRSRDLFMA
jgi:hypothetical protein